jgi:ABC-type amino acid transport substrate-binding protein
MRATPGKGAASAPRQPNTDTMTLFTMPTCPATALRLLALSFLAALGLGATPAQAGPVLDRVQATQTLRVCIWPDYYGVSLRNPRTGQLGGIDIDLSAELARELGVKLAYVDSSFPKLVPDLTGDRCDVAMFAIAMLPQRMEQLRFTRPYLQSDIYAITTQSNRVVRRWEDIDRPGVAVAVQAGTFMEPVMAQALKQAQLVRVAPPATRERELEAGRVDVFMTDYPYSRRLLDNADWALLISPPQPFHVLPYAYAVKPGDADWLARVDSFVERIQGDGRLEAAARRHGLAPIVRLK